MKIAGQEVSAPNEDILVIPRGTGADIVFTGRAIKSFDTFNALCKQPEPPSLLTRSGKEKDIKDTGYLQQVDQFATRKLAWMLIETLKPTDIEWDTVEEENPNTWENWVTDFQESGLTAVEQQKIMNFVMEVNSLNQAKLDKARADFLRGRETA